DSNAAILQSKTGYVIGIHREGYGIRLIEGQSFESSTIVTIPDDHDVRSRGQSIKSIIPRKRTSVSKIVHVRASSPLYFKINAAVGVSETSRFLNNGPTNIEVNLTQQNHGVLFTALPIPDRHRINSRPQAIPGVRIRIARTVHEIVLEWFKSTGNVHADSTVRSTPTRRQRHDLIDHDGQRLLHLKSSRIGTFIFIADHVGIFTGDQICSDLLRRAIEPKCFGHGRR